MQQAIASYSLLFAINPAGACLLAFVAFLLLAGITCLIVGAYLESPMHKHRKRMRYRRYARVSSSLSYYDHCTRVPRKRRAIYR